MRKRCFTFIALLLAVMFSSCTEKPVKKNQTMRMNICREPATMDPRQGSELIGSAMNFILFEGLMRFNPDGSVTPAQAKSVEISDDRKTYTFHLRGTAWSDGSPVIAADFENAWKKILSPDFPAPNAHLLYPIKNSEAAKKGMVSLDQVGIHAADDKTLIVEVEKPTPYFLDLISFCVFFPVPHAADETDPHWMRGAGDHFISNGPFKLASWKHNSEIILEKNRLYWEAEQINLDQIQVSMVSDENTALNMYENGELDLMGLGLSPLPNDILVQYFQRGLLKTEASPATTIVCFNVAKFPFYNKNIRKAFAYAIHRQEIVDNITQLGEEIATNIIPPRLKNNATVSYFNDYDVKKAQEFFQRGLHELGIESDQFPSLTYYFSSGDLNSRLAQTLQQQWEKALGITVQLQHAEHKVFLDRLRSRTYDLAQSFWMAQYKDPLSIFERFKYKTNAKNYPGWEHPEYVRLLEKTATDASAEERMKTFEAAEALFIEEMPLAPLYHWKTAYIIKDHLSCKDYDSSGFLELTRIGFKDPPL